jgi:hypothetical protein
VPGPAPEVRPLLAVRAELARFAPVRDLLVPRDPDLDREPLPLRDPDLEPDPPDLVAIYVLLLVKLPIQRFGR